MLCIISLVPSKEMAWENIFKVTYFLLVVPYNLNSFSYHCHKMHAMLHDIFLVACRIHTTSVERFLAMFTCLLWDFWQCSIVCLFLFLHFWYSSDMTMILSTYCLFVSNYNFSDAW